MTIGGKALTEGNVQFNPASGGEPLVALIDPEGKYSLNGLKPGNYLVTVFVIEEGSSEAGQIIKKRGLNTKGAPPPQAAPASAKPKVIIPAAYTKNDTTPVKPSLKGGKNKLDIAM